MLSVLCILARMLGINPSTFSMSHIDISRNQEPLGLPAGMDLTRSGNGRTTDVLWDKYSLIIKGQRVFIQ